VSDKVVAGLTGVNEIGFGELEAMLEKVTNDSLRMQFDVMDVREIVDYILEGEEMDALKSSLVFSYMVLVPERAGDILEEASSRHYFQRNEKPWRMTPEQYKNGLRRDDIHPC